MSKEAFISAPSIERHLRKSGVSGWPALTLYSVEKSVLSEPYGGYPDVRYCHQVLALLSNASNRLNTALSTCASPV